MDKKNIRCSAGPIPEYGKFWMVLRGENGGTCAQRHPTFIAAREEAERLARKEGVPFYVLEAIGRVEVAQPVPPVVWDGDYGYVWTA